MKTAYYIPDKTLSNEDFASLGWDATKIYDKTGIKIRHISAEDEFALDLAERACLTHEIGDRPRFLFSVFVLTDHLIYTKLSSSKDARQAACEKPWSVLYYFHVIRREYECRHILWLNYK